MTEFVLDCFFRPSKDLGKARLEFLLTNTGTKSVSGFSLAYTALTRASGGAVLENAQDLTRVANFHEVSPPEDMKLAPGQSWRFAIEGLANPARHRLDGPKSAYLTCAGTIKPVHCNDLSAPEELDSGERKSVPTGQLDYPVNIVPWPKNVEISECDASLRAFRVASATPDETAAVAKINALTCRLFPDAPTPFKFAAAPNILKLGFAVDGSLPKEGYALGFSKTGVMLKYNTPVGRDYGLTVLAQIAYGTYSHPGKFKIPVNGTIEDAPRFEWRGTHLDVSRHFRGPDDIKRLLDILAWGRMNVFQWHLTDDEGWRLEIRAFPELTKSGARRGPGCQQVGQLGFSHEIYEGFYTQADVRDIVAHATSLNIEILPEIDVPGHSTAILKTYPKFADQAEPPESYHSIQGYPNNALNPAREETYEFLEKVFLEVAELFPCSYVHIGGDEVDHQSWLASPSAQRLMDEKNLAGTMELQAYFMGRMRDLLRKLGKKLAGWDEVSQGGGIDPDGVLLMAWQTTEVTKELITQGYDVICTPGQRYYLDMAQASGWQEPGASWAGVSTPEASYTYEPGQGLDNVGPGRLIGVQACIWCEHLTDNSLFNYMVFPRLYAVAEAGWTPEHNKDWQRFAALTPTFPTL